MNRKKSRNSLDKDKDDDLNELLFDVYVRRRWYYIGDNNSLYLSDYKRYKEIDSSTCFLCERNLCKGDKIFYISDLIQNKAVGKCCIKKIHGYGYGYEYGYNDMRRLRYNKIKLKLE